MSRYLKSALVVLCVLIAGIAPVTAAYPARAITLVVPYAAGGLADSIARIIAERMASALGQPIIIENDPGAGGTTAVRRAARASADGYTLLMGHMGTHGAAPALYPNLKYDPVQDFTPIGLAAEAPAVIVTRKDFPANSLEEFLSYVKSNQDTLNEAHAGVGSQNHLYCTLLQSIMGTKTARIAYRGGAPAINDLVAGQVDFICTSLGAVVSQIQGGAIKAIAIASSKRADVIKDVPTTIEAGLPEFQVSGWNAIFAPKDLPQDIQTKLSGALAGALDDPATANRLLEIGCLIPDKSDRASQALRARVQGEIARWSSVLRVPGVVVNQ